MEHTHPDPNEEQMLKNCSLLFHIQFGETVYPIMCPVFWFNFVPGIANTLN